MSIANHMPMTEEDYLGLERLAEFRHELIHGERVVKSCSCQAHSLINTNLSRIISTELLKQPWEVYANQLRVRAEKHKDYFYPDLVIAIDGDFILDNETTTLTNPTVIIEILSPSTEQIDRGPKFQAYLKMPSLLAYLLIAQDQFSVEVYSRQAHGWLYQNYQQPDDVVEIQSVGVRLTVSEIYHKVGFPPEPNPEETSTNA
jgi:Uma2 family endonuclease